MPFWSLKTMYKNVKSDPIFYWCTKVDSFESICSGLKIVVSIALKKHIEIQVLYRPNFTKYVYARFWCNIVKFGKNSRLKKPRKNIMIEKIHKEKLEISVSTLYFLWFFFLTFPGRNVDCFKLKGCLV